MFIKMSKDALVKPLTVLFNKSLSYCKVPSLWKTANVISLHKKNSKQDLSNYQPVSLLSIVGKLMEKIMFKYLFNHFRDNFLLSIWQSGFRPGYSTVTQLIEVYNSFCTAVSEQKEIRVVFLDISKAFDKVWHQGLLYKLKRWGIGGQVILWLENYLSERYQRVIVNGNHSDWKPIKAGVPQGSVLRPLLFLVFINDLTYVVKHCQIRIFADDTCLFITVDNRDIASNLINADLKAIEDWSNQWLVTFSAPKTESMLISLKHNQEPLPRLLLHNEPIVNVQQHKHQQRD